MVSVVGLFWRAWAHVFYFCGIFISHQIRGRSDKGISSSSLKKLCCCENKYAVFTGEKNVEEDVHQKGKNPGLHALKNGWKKKMHEILMSLHLSYYPWASNFEHYCSLRGCKARQQQPTDVRSWKKVKASKSWSQNEPQAHRHLSFEVAGDLGKCVAA